MLDIPIHTIRKQKVIFDSNLATIYGVTTKVFNQAVKRNEDRFLTIFDSNSHRKNMIIF